MVTTYGKNLIMNHVFHTANEATLPTKYYLALSTTTPTVAGGNFTEPSSSTGYARIEITGLSNASNGVVVNGSLLSFAESTAAQGTVTYYGIYDATSSGNLILYGQLGSSRIIESQTTLSVKAGELSLSLVDA